MVHLLYLNLNLVCVKLFYFSFISAPRTYEIKLKSNPETNTREGVVEMPDVSG
jgi:hypothetical protein